MHTLWVRLRAAAHLGFSRERSADCQSQSTSGWSVTLRKRGRLQCLHLPSTDQVRISWVVWQELPEHLLCAGLRERQGTRALPQKQSGSLQGRLHPTSPLTSPGTVLAWEDRAFLFTRGSGYHTSSVPCLESLVSLANCILQQGPSASPKTPMVAAQPFQPR